MKLVIVLVAAAAIIAGAVAGAALLLPRPRIPEIQPRPEVTIRIGEGETLTKLAARLASAGHVSTSAQALAYWQLAIVAAPTATRAFMASVKPASVNLEGYLFPDTYRAWADDVLASLTAKALRESVAVLDQLGLSTSSRSHGLTVHEVLTLASIIEREVPGDEDRAKVADVFLKRLAIGLALQSDATVNYALGTSKTQSSAEDIAVDSPYNTYRYRGLPPGPIGAPSLSAIRAVLNPLPNDYYYFLTTPEGEVIYSRTNEEHAAAKRKYLR